MGVSQTANFANTIPVQQKFIQAVSKENYKPIPSDWFVAVSDVVQSRRAIGEGKYKAVNMAGVSMISAIMNALGHQEIPYIFGGDGAAMAFAPEDHEAVVSAMAATVGWVEDDLGLQLRAAVVPVSKLRESGFDLLVTGVRVSENIKNYAFLGGGIAQAEKMMKDGEDAVQRASAGVLPDLTGLSCRWKPLEDPGKKIVSLIVEPTENGTQLADDVVERLMKVVGADSVGYNPVTQENLRVNFSARGVALEVKSSGKNIFSVLIMYLLVLILDKTGWNMGGFDPTRYREHFAKNTDYRKIQDGIRMTVCLNEQQISALRGFLETERVAESLKYGLCEQDEAVLTCYVPSATSDDHFHFLDGAGGGYAAAADNLR